MSFDLHKLKGREPLADYPWRSEVDRLLEWLIWQAPEFYPFCFDMIMSAAYIDAASDLAGHIEACDNAPNNYNAHLGFINLCSPCYSSTGTWQYQKAIKPQSGALGKLSSEIILRFIEKLYPEIENVIAIGGTKAADALLSHQDGIKILAEVKSAPLLTYPFLFEISQTCLNENHERVTITQSQFRDCPSAIYLHNNQHINLGQVGEQLWPFKPLVDFLIDPTNIEFLKSSLAVWQAAKHVYANKIRDNKLFYLANASGTPPKIATTRDGWPKSKSISDSKTSAGMDRTDDIKKGVYQSLKIGTQLKNNPNVKTAIISNLPAYRHGADYVEPFVNMYWGLEDDLQESNGAQVIMLNNLRRVFDFIITLEETALRQDRL